MFKHAMIIRVDRFQTLGKELVHSMLKRHRMISSMAYPEYFFLVFCAVYLGQLSTIYSGERKREIFWIHHWISFKQLNMFLSILLLFTVRGFQNLFFRIHCFIKDLLGIINSINISTYPH